ncbi:MAG: Diguanylate cyclase/phosphodiesterase, partial [Modestobacter sp.]|nr:Diguanylate cyclase/phosphodiesterase [Modestobacter sp.]
AGFARRCPRGRQQTSWALLSLACAAWAAGQAHWAWLAASGRAPFPSVADIGFLGFSVLAVTALLVQPAGGGGGALWQRVFDAVMISAAVGLVGWQTTIGAIAASDTVHSAAARALLLSYPIADVALVVLTVLLLSRTHSDRTALDLVGLGVIAMGVADSTFAYLEATSSYAGGAVDVAWVVAFGLIATAGSCAQAAGSRRSPADDRCADRRRVTFLPYLPVVAALLVVLVGSPSGQPLGRGAGLTLALIVGMVLARQYVALRANGRLAADLATRETELRHQAFHDSLTGLPNRALFRDRLEHALALHARDGRAVSVVFLDLDDFKAVNDGHGHAFGDQLLARVAERLTGGLRSGDTIARLGGDEFAVLLEDDGESVTGTARIHDALAAPFAIAGHSLAVRASIGVCVLGPADPALSAEQLLARSDAAMYAAKRAGGARVVDWAHGPTRTPPPLVHAES